MEKVAARTGGAGIGLNRLSLSLLRGDSKSDCCDAIDDGDDADDDDDDADDGLPVVLLSEGLVGREVPGDDDPLVPFESAAVAARPARCCAVYDRSV